MDDSIKNRIINRINTGIIYQSYNNNLYKLIPASKDIIALSELVYEDIINNCKFDSLITKEQALFILNKRNIWSSKDDEQIKTLNKSLEDYKMALYKALYNKNEQKKIRRQISNIENSLNKLFIRKSSLDYMTLESFAQNFQEEFIIANCILDSNLNQVYNYNNFWISDPVILNIFIRYLKFNTISISTFKEIARTEPFRSIWSVSKEKIFNKFGFDLTIEQKYMIMFSRMYDNVYESLDRPCDEVIENDDMLDGWFIYHRRDYEQKIKQKEADELLGKKEDKTGKNRNNNAGELFVMASSKEEAANVMNLNDIGNRMKIKERENATIKMGSVLEEDLPDVKLELMQQAKQQMADRFKRK